MKKPLAKKRLIYVGHYLHLKTRSTQFLIDILKTAFSVKTVAVDPDDLAASNINFTRAECDVVVVLQLDFLAPIFIARGIPTVVAPMFDGSEHMPELHWQFSNQARFLSFSRHLHVKIQRAGGQSLLVKYFPEAMSRTSASKYRELAGFFWERRPDTGVNATLLARLFGSQLDRLHIHQAPDLPLPEGPSVHELFGETQVTTSTWFEDKSELTELVSRCNVYFAPRLSEGIGMGFLEAMASGAVVVANDASTHNEYINNWVTGILYSMQGHHTIPLDLRRVAEMGEAARQSVADGRPVWLKQIDQMIDWIDTCPEPDVGDAPKGFLDSEIPKAYMAGFGTYRRFLRRNAHMLDYLAPAIDSTPVATSSVIDDTPALMPALRQPTIAFGSANARQYLSKGWSHDEPGFVWIDGPHATLHFSPIGELARARVMVIKCHAPPLPHPQRLAIVVNGAFTEALEIASTSNEYTVALPENGLGQLTEIALFAEQTSQLPGESRRLSAAVSSINFK